MSTETYSDEAATIIFTGDADITDDDWVRLDKIFIEGQDPIEDRQETHEPWVELPHSIDVFSENQPITSSNEGLQWSERGSINVDIERNESELVNAIATNHKSSDAPSEPELSPAKTTTNVAMERESLIEVNVDSDTQAILGDFTFESKMFGALALTMFLSMNWMGRGDEVPQSVKLPQRQPLPLLRRGSDGASAQIPSTHVPPPPNFTITKPESRSQPEANNPSNKIESDCSPYATQNDEPYHRIIDIDASSKDCTNDILNKTFVVKKRQVSTSNIIKRRSRILPSSLHRLVFGMDIFGTRTNSSKDLVIIPEYSDPCRESSRVNTVIQSTRAFSSDFELGGTNKYHTELQWICDSCTKNSGCACYSQMVFNYPLAVYGDYPVGFAYT